MYFSEVMDIQKELENAFRNDFRRTPIRRRSSYPLVNIYEADEKLKIFAEVPGLKKDDLEIKLEDDLIIIKGEVKDSDNEESIYHRKERSFGHFSKAFKLPFKVNGTNVEAKLEDGILKVVLEKDESMKARKIEIN